MTVAKDAWTPAAIADTVEQAQAEPCTTAFHALWYFAKVTWGMTTYKGVPMLKNPLDMQIYHELIWQLRPRWVVETGTCFGGSALWFTDQLAEWGGEVVSIDVDDEDRPQHERLHYLTGDSASPDMVAQVRNLVSDTGPVLVSLDSDHHQAHVLSELSVYAPLVTPGSFLVVEDTNISGRPITANDPGPGAALDEWLPQHPEFQPNALCERYILTCHPRGWLQRAV